MKMTACVAARRDPAPHRVAVVFALAAMVVAPALAQTIPSHPNDLVFNPLEFEPPVAEEHRHVLSNGVVAFVVEDPALPLVSVSVTIRTGAYLEPEDKPGVASLTGSQMRAGGTASLSAAEFDEETAFLAAQISISIGATSGNARFNSLTKDVDATLDLFFEMLRYPRFEQARIDLAKRQILQRMERRNDSTQSIERREWGRLIRGEDHFSTRSATRLSLESIAREDLVAFHARYFHPGAFLIAVSGDVRADDVLAKLEDRMADWPVQDGDVPPVPEPTHELRPGVYVVDKSDVNQGRVTIGHLGTQRDNPDRYALLVMNDILGGGGFSSRLLTRIRSDEGLAYSAYSTFGLGTYYDGVFQAGFQSRSETVSRAAAIVGEEFERIRSVHVSESELRTAKASFIETFTRNFSSATSTAGLFVRDEYTGRDPGYLAEYRDNVSAVSGDDVLRVAREYLDPDKLVILVVGDIATIENGDPENPEYSLDGLVVGPVTRIPLPDPFTLEYPAQP
jgi:zinc protease